ncbi:MAG: exonuclease domain-containing protein, partial [Endomicrobiia bacterium]
MVYIPKKWIIKENNIDLIGEISNRLNISRAISAVLVNRGLKNIKEADVFLNPNFFDLENPFSLWGMEEAVRRLRTAIENKEKILIYGDRDVDGVVAVSIMYFALKSFGVIPLWFIPSEEGYGLHKHIIDSYVNEGVHLIITVDCGISNSEEISYAKSKGIDVIVTDHHEPPENLPQDAVAIIDPKLKENKNVFFELAGCVVALKLAQALMMSYENYYDKDMVIVDIETTGLHPVFDEIVEIAAIKIRNFVIKETFHSLIKPNKKIPKDVIEIHGITNEMCENAPLPEEVIKKFIEFIGNSPIIAHNAQFDLSFIRNYAKKFLDKEIDNPVIDTLSLSREFFPFRSHALGSLIRDLGFEFTHLHRALDDAIATLSVFWRLEQIKNTRLRFFLQDNLDLATIGTIGDMMPLIRENRIIVKHGLNALKKSKRAGLRILIENFFTGEKITAKNISFNIIPLLNSCGRMGHADLAVKLLISENRTEAESLIKNISSLNDERRELQLVNIEKFLELLKVQCDLERDKLFFVVGKDLEHGVTGIVASQIVKQYY